MIVDDKSEICIPFILDSLNQYRRREQDRRCFFIGLNGLQGVGKTTLVTNLSLTLKSPPYSLSVVVLSIDDLYLTHDEQVKLADQQAANPLVQHRGEPGTHDIIIAEQIFKALSSGSPTTIPRYDKSQYNGQGDRAHPSTWTKVNEFEPKIEVVIFEGWCVGFKALTDDEVRIKWEDSQATRSSRSTLWKYSLEHLLFVNDQLRKYDVITDVFDVMIHIDAEDTQYVYKWRLQQEAELRALTGRGMTNEEVIHFVDSYYPAYELFTDTLRDGVLGVKGRQLRLIVGEDRRVKQSIII
ncbi:P-loop containing nucleoside triphosphate hydrolase protein [Lipomyces arxii]|uniref:P-loop containing nucleoside triphosphate hydrolase protein n=1 Tax=Lipomyces arxii TaxID=56418 RepID=UPI0034CEACF1